LNFIKIHEIILETIDNNFTLEDIAILCRNNSEASRIARYLIENKINVISSESLLLYKSPEVSFLLAFLKFILKPDDKISQTEIINFLLQNEKIEGSNLNAYLINLKNNSESITKTEDYDANLINLLKKSGFKTNLNELNSLPVFDLCEKLIREFFDKEDVNSYLQFFLDSVLKFTTQTNTNLSEFLEWWEKNKKSLSLVIPEGINAVKIMTIHKAKGLEFPVVIFPFANEKLNVSRNSIWVDYQDENLPELKTALFPTNKDLEEEEAKKTKAYQEFETHRKAYNSFIDAYNAADRETRIRMSKVIPQRLLDKSSPTKEDLAEIYEYVKNYKPASFEGQIPKRTKDTKIFTYEYNGKQFDVPASQVEDMLKEFESISGAKPVQIVK